MLSHSMRHLTDSANRAFLGAVLVFIALDIAAIAASSWITARTGTTTWSGEFEVADAPGPLTVTDVGKNGPLDGVLQPGDRLITINGNAAVDFRTVGFFGPAFGTGAHVEIERDGQRLVMTLPPMQVRLRSALISTIVMTVPGLVLLISGASVGLLRPQVRPARLFALAALLSVPPVVTFAGRENQLAGALSAWESAFVTLCHLGSPLHLVPALLFTATFPELPVLKRKWRVLLQATILMGGIAWIASAGGDICRALWPDARIRFIQLHPDFWSAQETVVTFFPAIAFPMMGLLVFQKYRGTKSATDRNRLRWMIGGALAGLMPLATYYLAIAVLTIAAPHVGLPSWTRDVSSLTIAVLPAAVAYAVARHRLFDIRLAVRRGLRYALALNVLRAAVALPVAVLAFEIVRDLDAPAKAILRRPSVWVALAGTSSLLYFRTSLLRLLDRYFLRPAENSELIVMSLIDELSRQETQNDIARVLASRINEWLHPIRMSLLFRRNSDGVLVPASTGHDLASIETHSFTAGPQLLDRLEREGHLVDSKLEIVVPIGGGDRRLIGVLALGPKHSEEPYSSKEKKLLELAAAQVLVVSDNADLRRRESDALRVRAGVLAQLDAKGIDLLQECPVCGACFSQKDTTCSADGARLTLTLPVERTIDQRWRLEQRLGTGGMGTVYRATDLRLDREVALKLMRASIASDDAAQIRFEREARVLARMHHPSIVTIYEYGCANPGGNYLVMELVSGDTLRRELKAGRIAPTTVARWFESIIDGVGYAHRLGVVHRDIKPENILMSSSSGRDVPKILDFGLARYRPGEQTVTVTAPGMVLGTLAYMAPEQLRGDPVDKRGDIFAMGVMLVEALFGAHPFKRDTSEATIAAILHDTVVVPWSLPQLAALQPVFDRCLAKDREDRFADCNELSAVLIPALNACVSPDSEEPSGVTLNRA